jgi:hypothetical protein
MKTARVLSLSLVVPFTSLLGDTASPPDPKERPYRHGHYLLPAESEDERRRCMVPLLLTSISLEDLAR